MKYVHKFLGTLLILFIYAMPALATGYYTTVASATSFSGILPVANGGTGSSSTSGNVGDVLTWDGNSYEPQAPAGGGGGLQPTSSSLVPFIASAFTSTSFGSVSWNGIYPPATTGNNFAATATSLVQVGLSNASRIATGADSGDRRYITMGSASLDAYFAFQNGPKYWSLIRTDSSVANVRFWVGLTSDPANTVTSNDPALSVAAFVFDSSTDSFWNMYRNDGSSTGTRTATAVPCTANTTYLFCVDMSDASTVKYYINGNLIATATTGDMPVASTRLATLSSVTTLTTAEKFLKVGPQNVALN